MIVTVVTRVTNVSVGTLLLWLTKITSVHCIMVTRTRQKCFALLTLFGRFHTVAKSVGYLYDVSQSAWNSAPTGRIFIKSYIGDVY
jgi:hypothetical protein